MTALPPRPLLRRIGITGLNLLVPGLGLLRTGPLRTALLLLATGPLVTLAVAGLFAALPTLGLFGWAALMLLLIVAWLTAWAVSLVMTWRTSRFALPHRRLGRWYALVGLFVVDMRRRDPPRIGDIAMVAGPDGTEYVKRVVALGGSTVAIRHGIPIVNGRSAAQRLVGTRPVPDFNGPIRAHVAVERLPGDPREHRVLDTETDGFLDDLPPRRVPAGHVYLLGDHRDRSADSRVPRDEGGLAMVPLAEVRGRALFTLWTADHRWLGTDLTR